MRRTRFRQQGRPHQLLVLADVSRPLRDEERQAWQRLIRVIGHEVNNTLTPIQSLAGTSLQMLRDSPETTMDQVVRALAVIEQRAPALTGDSQEPE